MGQQSADRGTRRGESISAQWLALPGWRKPLDTLIALGVVGAAAWLVLLVGPASMNPGPASGAAGAGGSASVPGATGTSDGDRGAWVPARS